MSDAAAPPLASLLDLHGKSAIVTGGAAGIGFAIAARLAEAGAAVTITDLDDASAANAVKELTERGYDVDAVTGDVSDPDDVARMFARTSRPDQHVDILVNNAGIYPMRPVQDMTLEEFRQVLAVNLEGTFLCSQHAARLMIAGGRGGRIINVTSIDALHPSMVGLAHYDASKHGMWGFTKNLALELAPHGIWVNALAPGGIATPGTSATSDLDPAILEQFTARIPMRRMGTPDEIGRAAIFLASDLAGYMTGTQVVVDGGALLM